MPSPTEEQTKLYNCKWEFTFNVREPCPEIWLDGAKMAVRKVVMRQAEGKPPTIEVSGPLRGRAYGAVFRSKRFSLDGKRWPIAPDWIIEAVRVAGFGRVEP